MWDIHTHVIAHNTHASTAPIIRVCQARINRITQLPTVFQPYEASNVISWVVIKFGKRDSRKEKRTRNCCFFQAENHRSAWNKGGIKVRIDDVGNHRLGNHRQNTLGRRELVVDTLRGRGTPRYLEDSLYIWIFRSDSIHV